MSEIPMIIRKATKDDSFGIHDSHMSFIQDICSDHYSREQIQAWGHRNYDEKVRLSAINNDLVWVLDDGSQICGHAHLVEHSEKRFCEIRALYLIKEVTGKGYGQQLMSIIKEETWSVKKIKQLREKTLEMSQPEFAALLNVSIPTVRAWEQGHNTPSGAAARLLEVIKIEPQLVKKLIA